MFILQKRSHYTPARRRRMTLNSRIVYSHIVDSRGTNIQATLYLCDNFALMKLQGSQIEYQAFKTLIMFNLLTASFKSATESVSFVEYYQTRTILLNFDPTYQTLNVEILFKKFRMIKINLALNAVLQEFLFKEVGAF